MILHTWSQTLMDHFHLHCLIPAGALSFDKTQWNPARSNFLFKTESLAKALKARFIKKLTKLYNTKENKPAKPKKSKSKRKRQRKTNRLALAKKMACLCQKTVCRSGTSIELFGKLYSQNRNFQSSHSFGERRNCNL